VVSVENAESNRDFLIGEPHSELSHRLLEFLGTKSFVTIIVVNAELAAHAHDAGRATSLHFINDFLDQQFVRRWLSLLHQGLSVSTAYSGGLSS